MPLGFIDVQYVCSHENTIICHDQSLTLTQSDLMAPQAAGTPVFNLLRHLDSLKYTSYTNLVYRVVLAEFWIHLFHEDKENTEHF